MLHDHRFDPAPPAVCANYVASRLGIAEWSPVRIERRIDWLVAHEGFPAALPVPPRRTRSGALRSPRLADRRWDRRPVDAWFDALIAEALRDAIDDAEQRRAADILDARAQAMAS